VEIQWKEKWEIEQEENGSRGDEDERGVTVGNKSELGREGQEKEERQCRRRKSRE
jgi:hypothetical protein